MNEQIRKWIMTIGVLLIGLGLVWANSTAGSTSEIRQDSVAACERNVADRKINQAAHRRSAAAMRVVAAASDNETLVREFNLAADRMTVLALSLDPLINIDCETELR